MHSIPHFYDTTKRDPIEVCSMTTRTIKFPFTVTLRSSESSLAVNRDICDCPVCTIIGFGGGNRTAIRVGKWVVVDVSMSEQLGG